MLKKCFTALLLSIGLFQTGWAAEAGNPYVIVDNVTTGILDIINKHKDDFEVDPDPFYCDLRNLLENVVDFKFIARNVMGPFGREATKDQVALFEETFKEDLIQTYARGLMSYGDQEIILLPAREDLEGKRRVSVHQEIHNKDDTYPLSYSFGLNREGEWKVTNLVLNGINLGKTFRNQFIQRTEAENGDIDKVINTWSSKLEIQQTSIKKDGTTSN